MSYLGTEGTQTTNLPKPSLVTKTHNKNIVIPVKIMGF